MEHLTTVFQTLLTMALTALPVMAAVLAARFLLRKAPRRFAYVLWAVVAFRLVCPVSVTSPVGLVRPYTAQRQVTEAANRYLAPTRTLFESAEGYERAVEHGREPIDGGAENYVITAPDGVSEPATLGSEVLPAVAAVWLAGMAVITAVSAGTYLRLRRRLATAVHLEGNVYQSEAAETPFVLGWLRPRVYVPFRLTEEERRYVLLHEGTHLRRGDHWWKLLGFALVTVYWWDPAVWLCWALFCRDMEMSCDEAVLRRLGGTIRTAYSESLLRFAAPGGFPALAFGEHGGVARIKNVLKWKKEKRWTALLAGAVVVLPLIVCGTNAVTGSSVTLGREGTALTAKCRLEEPIRAWALVQDVYEAGALRTSTVQVWGNTDSGWTDRRFTGALELRLTPEADGFAGTASCRWSVGNVDTEWTVELPGDHYTAAGTVTGDSNKQEKYALTGEDSVVLASFLFSARSDGGVTFYQADRPLTEAGDAVVQYRLVTSTGPAEDFDRWNVIPDGTGAYGGEETEVDAMKTSEEPFRDILGYDGFVRTETDGVGWSMRTYYAVEGDRTFPIAQAWGYHTAESYAVDLDGDGRKELVANVEYGADGHEDTLVYRRTGDTVEQGWLDLEGKLPNFNNWGINAHSVRYDPAEGVFRVRYALKNSDQYGTMEFRGLGDFQFETYSP